MYTFLFPWWWLMRNVCGKMIHSRAIPSQCCLGCLKLHLFISHHLVRPFIHLKRHGLYQDACKAHNSSVWPNPTIFREVPGSNLIQASFPIEDLQLSTRLITGYLFGRHSSCSTKSPPKYLEAVFAKSCGFLWNISSHAFPHC